MPSIRPAGVAATVDARLDQQRVRDRNPQSLDAAILQQAAAESAGYQKIDEIPFDFERRRLSVVVEAPDSGGRRLLITKGASEPIIDLSTAFEAAVRSRRSTRRPGRRVPRSTSA